MSEANRLAVLGAGAWGTALAIQAARAGNRVTLWARDPEKAAAMRGTHRNPRLPDAVLEGLRVTADAAEALEGASLAVLAVPMQPLRAAVAAMPELPPVVAVAKGVESSSLLLPLEVLAELRPGLPAAVLSGPNFAHEVAAGLPAAAVLASTDPVLRAAACARLATPAFRLYEGEDVLGVQICGAAKNVAAIAAGAAMGAGLGENARAALVTRTLAEIARLVVALGGRAETAAGLSGLGDLLLTCTGPSSRNFALGHALGRGLSPAEALADSRGVAEGAATAPALLARAAAAGVEMPVSATVAAVLAGRLDVAQAVGRLMERPRRSE
ncbi:NAD(P)H-dependent glycerol-3-phosphate dehydrogenase [Roseomonas gilardii]|uniref:Glycerol-3-phosphate dehydrogenase [NAD(P)+] n=1 Tax=Roseomonas gilardii TaxID=257708 RepID=A0A1L7AD43_9PROT|nr:NAD(P)H-dependent glycerol-3-phosphate dehydrogenase [Roseomonas gilardii]APT56718.1 glycerol-3-phosphate dehydrogenase [Roseomonas gilardii]MDT8329528.1 NAD(P)H-dependent glycerol-3-phosphate dehydrogenase [Roseomonas gilardii]